VRDRLKAYIEAAVPKINEELFSFLPIQEPARFLYEPMRDYPERGGKRFRSVLVLLGCEAVGGDPAKAMRTAAAFEMFQSFALVHDDIEDGSEMRRGKPCLHHIHGIPLAINVGDALYSKMFELLAANRDILGETKALDILDKMIVGARLTFEGQAFDIGWIEAAEIPTVDEFIEMLRRKTGWYSGRGPCETGAMIGDGTAEQVNALGEFGETMAVAFQIRDDLLNLTVSEADAANAPTGTAGGYGKERGGDIAEGKRTMMAIDVLQNAEEADSRRVREILDRDRDETTEAEVNWVIDLMVSSGAIDRATEECRRRADTAEKHLATIEESEAKQALGEMCSFLVERVF
jgi:geranylgeranyl pyrophosphate synthase